MCLNREVRTVRRLATRKSTKRPSKLHFPLKSFENVWHCQTHRHCAATVLLKLPVVVTQISLLFQTIPAILVRKRPMTQLVVPTIPVFTTKTAVDQLCQGQQKHSPMLVYSIELVSKCNHKPSFGLLLNQRRHLSLPFASPL